MFTYTNYCVIIIVDRGAYMDNKGLNNKGFTLVELLAVIVILLSISVVSITNVSASLKRRKAPAIDKNHCLFFLFDNAFKFVNQWD